jgi:hypothetical protein
VPRSAEHHLLTEELSHRGAHAGVGPHRRQQEIALTPDYLDAVRLATRGASAVILAEPYLLGVVEQLGLDLPVVYDAYNVESQLKRDVYPDSPIGRELLGHVVDIEQRAVRRADLVTTCSDPRRRGAGRDRRRDRRIFAVVPNGTELPTHPSQRPSAAPRSAPAGAAATGPPGAWRHEPEHLAVFFGSWHPPNLDAAELIIELAPSSPTSCSSRLVATAMPSPTGWCRATSCSPAWSRPAPSSTCSTPPSFALNPMRIGSGTNLKLLEYLAAGVPVVSTPFGGRGIDVVDGEHLRFAEPDALGGGSPRCSPTRSGPTAGRSPATIWWRALHLDHLGRDLAGLVADIVPARAGQ